MSGQGSIFDWVDALAELPPVPDVLQVGQGPAVAFEAPTAPQQVRMAPAARQARRSGRAAHRPAVVTPTEAMRIYRDTLRRIQPATDHQVSAAIRDALGLDGRDHVAWGLSTICGRRNDWNDLQADCIEAVDRVRPAGTRISRTRWRIKPGSAADEARR